MAAAEHDNLRRRVNAASSRIAELGGWGAHIDRAQLAERIPTDTEPGLGGFDAGIACALDMIPRNRQRLAATLHAAYTDDAVAQVRRETADIGGDNDTTWWLAACSVCEEGPVDADRFRQQLDEFDALAKNPTARTTAARSAHTSMLNSFEVRGDIAVATRDGGMQGAYIAGWDVAAMWSELYQIWFIGTPKPTLGLEGYPWRNPPGTDTRAARSGPVGGSRQFVKARDDEELRDAVAAIRLDGGDPGGRRITL